MRRTHRIAVGVLLLLGLAAPGLARAEEEKKETGWKDSAELAYVLTAGNSESSTLGLKNTLTRVGERSLFTLDAAAIRVETTTFTRTATGTVTDPVFTETKTSETTAENYEIKGKYEQKISDRFYWLAGAGWEQNRFAGIDKRYTGRGGVGNIWWDTDDIKFRTDYTLTYTDQTDVVEVPGVDKSYLGAQFGWDYKNKFGKNTEYENLLNLVQSLEESDQWRGDMAQSLLVKMSEHMLLKVGLRWLYENEPAYEEIPLTGSPGVFVPFQLDELDTIFTTSLVVNFD